MRVVIVGAGLMGAQIGVEYALGGHAVALVARRPEAALERAEAALATVVRHGLATAADAAAARARLEAGADALAFGPADLVVESLPEDAALKADALRPLAAAWPAATMASNTSSLSVAALGEAIGSAARTVGTHYWNPPLLMPVVELVAGKAAPGVVAGVRDALIALGKRPVLVEREVPGFVWNRLQLALLREALWIVEQGVATPETVDEIVRDGLARRWCLTGPFETVALGGAATFEKVAANLWPELSDASEAGGLAARVPTAQLDELRERRDEALARTLRAERGGN